MLQHKEFVSYEDYVKRQGIKLSAFPKKFKAGNVGKIFAFTRLFKSARTYLNPGKILCLGARSGWEVHGAINAGFKNSMGIDLFPASGIVIGADWHNMPFKNHSFENIFTNSLDHCYSLSRLIDEVKRVLKPFGVFFLVVRTRVAWKELSIEERMADSPNEALFWNEIEDLITAFEQSGFITFKSFDSRNYFMRLV